MKNISRMAIRVIFAFITHPITYSQRTDRCDHISLPSP